eukprot:GDKJ01060218.1.p1 GENE.GDKJ01060218.1~~GDKJ01060218.1.p1  ORF type:complete len:770 (-),score=138.12 GDKJ01060218.1:1140-3314(-)
MITLLSTCAAMDGCDDQLFPASFRALEHDLGFTPTNLGICSLSQTMAFALFSPAWARLAEECNRKWMLSLGCTMWGMCTIGLAMASDFALIVFLRFLNGIALASIGPIATATLSEITQENRRGFVFSLVQASKNTGRLVGGFLTTIFALQMFFGTLPGWRFAFLIVGVASILLAGVVLLCFDSAAKPLSSSKEETILDGETDLDFTEGPTSSAAASPSRFNRPSSSSSQEEEVEREESTHYSTTESALKSSHQSSSYQRINSIDSQQTENYGKNDEVGYGATGMATAGCTQIVTLPCGSTAPLTGVIPPPPLTFSSPWNAADLMDYFKLRSVLNIAIVELFIGIPWGALTFCTLWLQYLGMSDHNAAIIVSIQIIAIIVFSPVAGKLSDSFNSNVSNTTPVYAPFSFANPSFSPANSNGRTLLAQSAMLLRVPVLLLLFLWAPGMLYDKSSSSTSTNVLVDSLVTPPLGLETTRSLDPNDYVFVLALLCAVSGVFAALAGATNRPLITELVGPTYRTSTLAWIDCIEICIRAVLGAPLVGLLAEIFFEFTPMPNVTIAEMDPSIRRKNAYALGKALAACVVIPTMIAFVCYVPLHASLEKDKVKAYAIHHQHREKHWKIAVERARHDFRCKVQSVDVKIGSPVSSTSSPSSSSSSQNVNAEIINLVRDGRAQAVLGCFLSAQQPNENETDQLLMLDGNMDPISDGISSDFEEEGNDDEVLRRKL